MSEFVFKGLLQENGWKENTVVKTEVKTAFITSLVPSKAALIGDFPRSKCA